MAKNGDKLSAMIKLDAQLKDLESEQKRLSEQYRVTPTPEVDKKRQAVQKSWTKLQTKLAVISRTHTVPAYEAEIKKNKEEILQWSADLVQAKEALRKAVNLPVIPPGPGGVGNEQQVDPAAALQEEQKDPAGKNNTSVKLINAGEAEEQAGDKVTAALGDLAEG